MSSNGYVSSFVCMVLAVSVGVSHAQSSEPRDAWLMKNYRFTGPPAPGSIEPMDPVVAELRQIQNTLLSILRKTDFGKDYEAALAAADQATATAQLIGTITERLESAAAAKTMADEARANASTPIYAIAFKDHTIEAATAYWTDGLMLHYMTRQGAHVQVRLDLVDRDLSTRLNRANNLEFRLPE
jgi:hypothetical protein